MSHLLISAALLLFLLLFSSLEASPVASSSHPSAARAPAADPPPSGAARRYVALRLPARGRKRRSGFRGKEAEGCKPRGFRPPPSAPSRFVNYHTLVSSMCSPATKTKP